MSTTIHDVDCKPKGGTVAGAEVPWRLYSSSEHKRNLFGVYVIEKRDCVLRKAGGSDGVASRSVLRGLGMFCGVTLFFYYVFYLATDQQQI